MASDSVLCEANSFEYFFRYSGTGALANIIPVVAGKASLSLTEDVQHPLMVLDFLTVEREGSGEGPSAPLSYIAARDSFYRFDFTESSVVSAPISAGAAGVFDYPPASVMMELVIPHPFRDEIMADSIAVLFPDTIVSEPCYVFQVYYQGGATTSVWYISINDLIPRAVERLSSQGGEFLEIWDLRESASLLEPGETAPVVFLSGIDGFVNRITFPREKPVLLVFFTSDGANSLGALGTAVELAGDNVDVFGISLMETDDDLFRLNSLNIPFPILIHGNQAAEDYRVDLVPSAVLISADGNVVLCAEGRGGIDGEEFRKAVQDI